MQAQAPNNMASTIEEPQWAYHTSPAEHKLKTEILFLENRKNLAFPVPYMYNNNVFKFI